MEGSPLLDAMPRVLADAVRREGGDSVLAELATGAMSHCTELDNVTELNELTHVMAKAVLAGLNPLAQRLMVVMPHADRQSIMQWLCDPRPVADAMHTLVLRLQHDPSYTLACVEQAALIPELEGLLQEGVNMLPGMLPHNPDGSAHALGWAGVAEQFRRELDELCRGDLRRIPSCGEVSSSGLSHSSRKRQRWLKLSSDMTTAHKKDRRDTQRLARQRRACPVAALDVDMLRAVLLPLDAETLHAMRAVSRRWRDAASETLRCPTWCRSWGALFPSNLVSVQNKAGTTRLDIGAASKQKKKGAATTRITKTSRWRVSRLDGPSVGPVSLEHVVAVLAFDGANRLDLGVRPQVMHHESPFTRLRVVPIDSRVRLDESRPIQYGETVGFFSECGGWCLDATNACQPPKEQAHPKGQSKGDTWSNCLRLCRLDAAVKI